MSAREAAANVVVARILADAVDVVRDEANAAVLDAMDVGDRKAAQLDDGTSIGTVTVAQRGGSVSARVLDEQALVAYAKQVAPAEVVETIRPAFRTKLLARLIEADGETIDGDTGELVECVEFVQAAPPKPYVSVRLTEAHRHAVAKAWADGNLQPLLAAISGALPLGLKQ